MRLAAAGCAALAIVAVAPLAPAHAQSPTVTTHVLSHGARIRIYQKASEDHLVGSLTFTGRDSVVIDTTDARAEQRLFFPAAVVVDEFRTVSVPLATVERIEVSTGRNRLRGAWRTARRAATSAMVVGAIYGASRPGRFRIRPVANGLAAGAALGVAIGAPWGFTRGAERWRRIPLPGPGRIATAGDQ